MNPSSQLDTRIADALREQSSAIYKTWVNGNKATARAMLRAVPSGRTAHVTMTMAFLAVHEGKQRDFSQFIEGVTQ
jgi:hypothetical protein